MLFLSAQQYIRTIKEPKNPSLTGPHILGFVVQTKDHSPLNLGHFQVYRSLIEGLYTL